MPSGVTGGTTISDMHDFIDTVAGRTCFSVKEFGAIGTEVTVSGDKPARATIDTQAFLDAIAAAAASPGGGGAVYVPSGHYYITANTLILPEKIKIFGDGWNSIIRKQGSGFLLDLSGFGDWTTGQQERNGDSVFRDLCFHGQDNTGSLLRTVFASSVLIDNCKFMNNSGNGIDAVEWWDSRVMNCFFDWCSTTTEYCVRLRNSMSETSGTFGYSADSVNANYFYGCRFESFKAGAILIEQGTAANNDNPSQMFFTNTKCETTFFAGPVVKFINTATNPAITISNVHFDNFFIALNDVNSGYATVTDIIDWRVNNGCSLRNVWCFVGSPAATSNTIRSVVRANLSYASSTLENIFMAGTKPAGSQFVGVVSINSSSEPKLIGHIGGISSSSTPTNFNVTAVNGGGAYSRSLTAARGPFLLDDGILYRNTTTDPGTDVVVTLPDNAHPGWTCRALQTSTSGTITFQKVAASATTFVFENGTDHRRTGGAGAMVEVLCISNNSTNTAAQFHIRGKTVAQAGIA
jgi:hypothetical protein